MSKFSNLKLRYKVGVGVATGAAILSMAGGAFAYFSGGTGSGSGSATATSTSPTVSNLTASATASGVAFDGSTTAVPVTLSNGNPYSVQVSKITLTINTADSSWGTAKCPTDSFSLGASSASGAPWVVGPKVGATNGSTVVNGYQIHFVDQTAENQDGCVGFAVPLSISIGS